MGGGLDISQIMHHPRTRPAVVLGRRLWFLVMPLFLLFLLVVLHCRPPDQALELPVIWVSIG